MNPPPVDISVPSPPPPSPSTRRSGAPLPAPPTFDLAPAPPAPPTPPPPAVQAPAEPTGGGRSRLFRGLRAAFIVLAAAGLAVALVFQFRGQQTDQDAQAAIRDARITVSQSFSAADRAASHVTLALQGASVGANRSGATADLNRVIALRQRALAQLADVPADASASYQTARALWSRSIRSSIDATRRLRTAVGELPGSDAARRTGLIALTSFVGTEDILRGIDTSMRRDNAWIR